MGYPFAYAYLIAFAGMTVLATLLAIAPSPQKIRVLRTCLVALLAGWALADFFSSIAETPAELAMFAKVFAPVWAAVPFTFLLTVLVYTGWPDWTRPTWVRGALALPALACVYLVHSGQLYKEFLPASVNGLHFQSRPTSFQAFVIGYILTYATLSVGVLFGAGRKHRSPQFRATGRILLRALVPAALVGAITNGTLSPFGFDLPYLGSILCSVVATIVGVGTIKRAFFAKSARFHQELATVLDDLNRRDEVLSALPIGVAIVEPDSRQMLYANDLFRSLSKLGSDGLTATLRSALNGPTKCDPATPCELVVSANGKDHTLLLSSHEVHYGGRRVDLLILRDVTATRALENEVARQRESLSHVQKMEAVGRVSAGIAHDFNNQLSVIATNATAVLQSPDTDDRHRMDLEEIISAVERGRRLTSQLLAFGRKQAPKPEVVDVNEVLRHLERVLQRLVGASIVLVVRCTRRPALVRIDRLHLEQVVLALATNAADAMPQGGTLVLEVARASDQVKLSVRDTGCGIAPEIIDRVFEPFFSTKGKLGTGLGLASAYSYTQTAGASIEVHSTMGKGTEFLLRFPPVKLDAQRDHEECVEATPQPARAALTILLVDDEEGVRRGFSRLLRRRGHRVLEASGAREAFALFDTEKVDVLVTDIAMPETDGRILASELRKKRGDLPVLFISGQFRESDSPKGPSVAFLAKPFPPEMLFSTLEALAQDDPVPLQPAE